MPPIWVHIIIMYEGSISFGWWGNGGLMIAILAHEHAYPVFHEDYDFVSFCMKNLYVKLGMSSLVKTLDMYDIRWAVGEGTKTQSVEIHYLFCFVDYSFY